MAVDGDSFTWPSWSVLRWSSRHGPARPYCSPLRLPVTLWTNRRTLSWTFLHRFQSSELTVRVGEYNLRVTSSTEQEYSVDGIIIHESFDRRSVRNDIALIRMEKKVIFTPDVKHICLPDPKMELEDQSAFVIGTRSTWSHCQALIWGTLTLKIYFDIKLTHLTLHWHTETHLTDMMLLSQDMETGDSNFYLCCF